MKTIQFRCATEKEHNWDILMQAWAEMASFLTGEECTWKLMERKSHGYPDARTEQYVGIQSRLTIEVLIDRPNPMDWGYAMSMHMEVHRHEQTISFRAVDASWFPRLKGHSVLISGPLSEEEKEGLKCIYSGLP